MNIKTVLNGGWEFVNSKIFLYILIILGVMLIARSCQKNGDLAREIIINKQNQLALTDTITTIRTKSGELNSSITAYILTEKELRNVNKKLFDDLKDQDGKVLTLNRAVIKLKQDKKTLESLLSEAESIAGQTQQINDSTYQLPWTLTYRYDSLNYDIFSGRTELFSKNCSNIFHNRTWLENRETQISLTFGQRVEDNKLRVFVQSGYPGFTTEALSGVLIDPNSNKYLKSLMKPKRWFPGFNVGIGTTMGYNVATGGYGLVIGPTFNWGIYSFKK